MTSEEVRESIVFFFDVIEGNYSLEGREANLRLALDRLALAVHYTDGAFDETDYPEAPSREYKVVRELVSPNFPDLGYYNVVLGITEKIGEGQCAVGDAIDDICDIARELEAVLWCWENTSVHDALWHFKFGFESHWGQHLRDLQLYLYAKEYGW